MKLQASRETALSVLLGLALSFYCSYATTAESLKTITSALSVSESGLIVLELDATLTTPANLFDLDNKTLRFSPTASGYSVEVLSSQYESSLGTVVTSSNQSLTNFQFDFAGSSWSEFYINEFGTLSFGAADSRSYFTDMRFQGLESLLSSFINTAPTLAVLFSQRLNGARYYRELADRAIVTWEVSEACCGIFEYIFERNANTFQAVLHASGVIEFNYKDLAVSEGLVGLFDGPQLATIGNSLAILTDSTDSNLPSHLDMISAEVSELTGEGIAIEITLREDFALSNIANNLSPAYRVHIDTDSPLVSGIDFSDVDYLWSVSIDDKQQLTASGPGVFSQAFVNDGKIVIQGRIPDEFSGGPVAVFIDTVDFSTSPIQFDQIQAVQFEIAATSSREIDLSAQSPITSGSTVYELFHYRSMPNSRDLGCQVLPHLGDNYDFLVSYSQFRMDKPEASTPVAPLETGVGGIGFTRGPNAAAYCSEGRLKSAHEFPIYMDANMATPAGPNGLNDGYNYALSLLGHEFGHTWGMNLKVNINGELVSLNDSSSHWVAGLHTPVVHPWVEIVQASAMGGGNWLENQDGTFTQRADNFFSPASGFSYLDLYLMGVIPPEEVPDFFLLQNLQYLQSNAQGQAIYSGNRIDLSIEDIIAQNGTRTPTNADSQKDYKVAFVYLLESGTSLEEEKFTRMGEIRDQFSNYYSFITGGLGSMTTSDSDSSPSNSANFELTTSLLTVPSLGVGSDSFSLNFELRGTEPIEFELVSYQLLSTTPNTFTADFSNGVLTIPELFVSGQRFRVELTIVSEEPPLFRLSSAVEL